MTRFLSLGTAAALLLPAVAPANIIAVPLGNGSVALRPIPVPPAPTPTATPAPFPSPVFTPAPAPTPTAAATARPTPRATPTSTATPTPRATPTARSRPTPARSAEPEPTPVPSATPTPAPAATASPASIETVVLPQTPPPAPIWPWLAGGAALLLALAALLLRRRGRPDDEEEFWEEPPADTTPPVVASPTVPPGRLGIAYRPSRAGLNLLTATVEAEVEIANVGDMTASDIRAAVTLLGAGAGGGADAALAAIAALPVTQPAAPPFTLAPGETRRFRAVAALPHDAIQPLTVAGRPMFVPLVGITVQWRDGATARRTTQGFAVGVERVDSAKLAPLWLDVPSRTYDSVAARPHGEPRED